MEAEVRKGSMQGEPVCLDWAAVFCLCVVDG